MIYFTYIDNLARFYESVLYFFYEIENTSRICLNQYGGVDE